MSDQPEVIQAETLRNIGCCGLAAATSGRQHYNSCVNHQAPEIRPCEICGHQTVEVSVCRVCQFVAHVEGC